MGRSGYRLDGDLTNYIGYALLEGQPLRGSLSFRSQRFDLNEFMAEEASAPAEAGEGDPAPSSVPTEEVPMEVFPVPADLDLNLEADLVEVIYDNLTLKNMRGRMRIVSEELDMEEVSFDAFGGKVAMNGLYNTQNLQEPSFNFYLDLSQVAVEEIFQSFAMVRAFAPALEKVEGQVDSELGLSGLLGPDMMPKLEVLQGLGQFAMQGGSLSATPALAALAQKTKLKNLTPLSLKDVQGSFQIEDGYLSLSPLDLKVRDVVVTIGGRQRLDGALDYDVTIDAPSTAVDQAAITALSNLTRTQLERSDRVSLNLELGGTYRQPKVTGAGGGTADQVKDQLADQAEGALKDRTGADVELDRDSLKAQANQAKEQLKDTLASVVDSTKQQVKDSLARAANQAKEDLTQEAKDKLEDLKNQFGLPFGKKQKEKKKKKDGKNEDN